MLTVDLLHEFELGVWKAVFTHLIRILAAHGQSSIHTLNHRSVTGITHAFSSLSHPLACIVSLGINKLQHLGVPPFTVSHWMYLP